MSPTASLQPLIGFLSWQTGMGAVWTGALWLWLAPSGSHGAVGAPILPLIFSYALPAVIAWLPLTIISPFLTRGRMGRLIAFLPAAAALILFAGRRLTLEIGGLESDLLLVICFSALIQLAGIAFTVTHPLLRSISGTATCVALFVGAGITGLLGSLSEAPVGLVAGAGFLTLGACLPTKKETSSASPWIAAERRLTRFARLFALLRLEKPTRNRLLGFALLSGLTLTSLAWLPRMWPEFGIDPGPSPITLPGLAWLVSGFWLGFSLASLSRSATLPLPGGPSAMAAMLTLGTTGALILFAIEPMAPGITGFFIALPLGLTARISREALRTVLDFRGHRLPRETEALVGTALAAATLLFSSLAALGLWLPSMRLPVTVLFLIAFAGTALLWWRGLQNPVPHAAPAQSPPMRAETPFWDSYLPGFPPGNDQPESPVDGRAITILHEVPEENLTTFHQAMAELAKVRHRQGALHWRLTRDLDNPRRLSESYLLESWSDYQEAIRHESPEDRAAKQRVFDLDDWDSLPLESHEAILDV